jgi:membrane-associated protease RseP (regulator of RpoE activity)
MLSNFLALNLVILIHELGHYSFFKLFKIPVKRFAIGFGKKIFSYKIFKIGCIPLGGYVQPEDGVEISAFQMIFISLGGCLFNLLTAFILRGNYTITYFRDFAILYIDNLKAFLNIPLVVKSVQGPIGAIQNVDYSFIDTVIYYSSLLCIFNLLPLYILDGGKFLVSLVEAIARAKVKQKFLEFYSAVSYLIIVVLLVFALINDLKGLL